MLLTAAFPHLPPSRLTHNCIRRKGAAAPMMCSSPFFMGRSFVHASQNCNKLSYLHYNSATKLCVCHQIISDYFSSASKNVKLMLLFVYNSPGIWYKECRQTCKAIKYYIRYFAYAIQPLRIMLHLKGADHHDEQEIQARCHCCCSDRLCCCAAPCGSRYHCGRS